MGGIYRYLQIVVYYNMVTSRISDGPAVCRDMDIVK
jgi:hypothetical protein